MKRYSYHKNSDKKIWVDLDNSPHVLFFAPIVERLKNEGYNVCISARNYAQTISLAELFGLDFKTIGKHYGKHKLIKLFGLFYRSFQLLPFVLKNRPTIALSHGSRSQMIIAKLLKIHSVVFLDYEFVQTIPFANPDVMVFPNLISKEKLKEFKSVVKTYPGIKEDIYVPNFKPDPNIKKDLAISDNKINVVLRPPAYEAHYHNHESDLMFNKTIELLTTFENVQTIILPRDEKQKLHILENYKKSFESEKLKIPNTVVDALNLMWYSDLVISGGGTMNREATALGIPVYSIFRGKIGDVDKYLASKGKLILLESVEDIKNKIKLEKWQRPERMENLNSLALHTIIKIIDELILNVTNPKNKKVKLENGTYKNI